MTTQPTYQLYNEDCVSGMADRLTPASVQLCITSIPFGALFAYSAKTEDIGNNQDFADVSPQALDHYARGLAEALREIDGAQGVTEDAVRRWVERQSAGKTVRAIDMRASHFGLNMHFFVHQLYRVLEPGALACIHVQQLLTTKVQHGFMGRRDFRGAVVDLFTVGGFDWTGEFVIPKDPQIAAKRLQLHSLQFTTGHSRDARAWSPFVNDYVLLFRKPGDGGTSVRCHYHPHKNPEGWVTREEWIRDAHGVWSDINEVDVLDGYKSARETDEEKHVCPLQLTVARRLVRLYSNPDALVLDPFAGIGTVPYVALEQGRNAVGFELKTSYWDQAVRNCEKALARRHATDTLPLLDWMNRQAV